jgi:hypothetical protein
MKLYVSPRWQSPLADPEPEAVYATGSHLTQYHDCQTVLRGQTQVCELLLARGAAIDMQGSDGRTALMVAISGQNEDIVSMLLARKANLNIRANNGETALSIAERELPNLVPALKKTGDLELGPVGE